MPERDALPIRIVEGGERLYLYPYAIFTEYRSLHFEYLHLQEFEPYWDHMQDFFGRDQSLSLPQRFWYLIVRRFWATVVQWWRCGYPTLRSLEAAWTLCYPLRCSSLCPVRLGIDNQLKVEDLARITETDYLVPSPAYLFERINRSEPPDPRKTGNLEHSVKWQDWVQWRNWVTGLPAGSEIRFVVELDT